MISIILLRFGRLLASQGRADFLRPAGLKKLVKNWLRIFPKSSHLTLHLAMLLWSA